MESYSGWESRITPETVLCDAYEAEPLALSKFVLSMARYFRGRVYVLIDLARNDDALRVLAEAKEEYESLFRGTPHEKHFMASPVLLAIRHNTRTFRWLVGQSWKERGCLFLISQDALEDVATSLKRFLTVTDEYGVQHFFRFADPLVLATFLRASLVEERLAFMDKMECLITRGFYGETLFFPRAEVAGLDPPDSFPAPVEITSPYPLHDRHQQAVMQLLIVQLRTRLLSFIESEESGVPQTLERETLLDDINRTIDLAKRFMVRRMPDIESLLVTLVTARRERRVINRDEVEAILSDTEGPSRDRVEEVRELLLGERGAIG